MLCPCSFITSTTHTHRIPNVALYSRKLKFGMTYGIAYRGPVFGGKLLYLGFYGILNRISKARFIVEKLLLKAKSIKEQAQTTVE